MASVGIDIDSVTVKAVVLSDSNEIIAWALKPTGPIPRNSMEQTYKMVTKKLDSSKIHKLT